MISLKPTWNRYFSWNHTVTNTEVYARIFTKISRYVANLSIVFFLGICRQRLTSPRKKKYLYIICISIFFQANDESIRGRKREKVFSLIIENWGLLDSIDFLVSSAPDVTTSADNGRWYILQYHFSRSQCGKTKILLPKKNISWNQCYVFQR